MKARFTLEWTTTSSTLGSTWVGPLRTIAALVSMDPVDLGRIVAKVIWTVQQLLGHIPLGTPVSIRISMKRRFKRPLSEHYDDSMSPHIVR